MKWFKIVTPAPVLNTSDFAAVFGGKSGCEIPINEQGHPPSYEFVALPRMYFSLTAEVSEYVIQVQCPEYSSQPYYLDRRFGQIVDCNLAEEPMGQLEAGALLAYMESRLGTAYVWAGNWAEGIPKLLELYKPTKQLDPRTEILWTFRGLDCSGLLFEASSGRTPRNSTLLVHYGKPLETDELRPMDMIVYPGHVLFVRDSETIIESKSPYGVRIYSLKDRLAEIKQERTYVRHWSKETDPTKSFTIRRFC